MTAEPRRDVGDYSPGRIATVTVSATGTVDAVDRDAGTVTIAGHTYPIRLSETVRHASMLPPEPTRVVMLDECDGSCGDPDEADRVARGWHDAIRLAHYDDAHPDAFPVCAHALCRRTRETYR